MLTHVVGDLFDYASSDTYLLHQCNTMKIPTSRLRGIAKTICERWPHAETQFPRKVGTIQICGGPLDNNEDLVGIVNIFGQRYPGKARFTNDSTEKREEWFWSALCELGEQVSGTVYVPHRIGCDLAGGNWAIYEDMLRRFADDYDINVVVVQLPR